MDLGRRQRDRKTEIDRKRETERQRHMETEKQRDSFNFFQLCVASLVLVSAFIRKLSLIRISFWTTVFDIVLTLVLFLYAIILIFVIISQKGTVGGWYVLIIYVIILCIECLWLWTIRQARRELEEEERKKRASIFSTKAMPTPWSMK